jgi:hypothetical protein
VSDRTTAAPGPPAAAWWEGRYHELAQEVRALLRALEAERHPAAHIAQSIVTQHHMDRLDQLTQPAPERQP